MKLQVAQNANTSRLLLNSDRQGEVKPRLDVYSTRGLARRPYILRELAKGET
jgi:hypothetical protein